MIQTKTSNKRSRNYSSGLTRSLPSIDLKSNGASNGEDKVNGHEDRSYCKKILITPDKAMELLKKNEAKNRRPKPGKIARYATDMKEGRWKCSTWEPIKIAEDGSLIDGQNRLYAVVKSGASILFHAAFNVPKDVFDVLDTGTPRNASDVFTIAGIKYGSAIPPIIQQFHVLKQNKNSANNVNHTDKLTNAELLDKYYQNENYWQEVAKKSFRWYDEFQKVVTVSVLGGFYAYLSTKSIQDAEKFMDQLATGNGIQNNVISKLRKKMFEDRLAVRKMPIAMKFGLILKSWNTFRSKGDVKQLKFDSEREAFPVAI